MTSSEKRKLTLSLRDYRQGDRDAVVREVCRQLDVEIPDVTTWTPLTAQGLTHGAAITEAAGAQPKPARRHIDPDAITAYKKAHLVCEVAGPDCFGPLDGLPHGMDAPEAPHNDVDRQLDRLQREMDEIREQSHRPVRPLSVRTCPQPYPDLPSDRVLVVEANGDAWFRPRFADDGRKVVVRWSDVQVVDHSLRLGLGIVARATGREDDEEAVSDDMRLKHSAAHRRQGDPLSPYICTTDCKCRCPVCAYEQGFRAAYGPRSPRVEEYPPAAARAQF